MKHVSTSFLKLVLLIVAIITLSVLVWFPKTEGRASGLDLISIYADSFIIYVYIASVPFFVALWQAVKLLGHIEENKVFSPIAVTALKNIKYCALAISGFLSGAMFFIRIANQGDDGAGPIMVGLITLFASIVIATAAAVFQELLQRAVDIKAENDLTV